MEFTVFTRMKTFPHRVQNLRNNRCRGCRLALCCFCIPVNRLVANQFYPYINEVLAFFLLVLHHPANISWNSLWGSLILPAEMKQWLDIMLSWLLSSFHSENRAVAIWGLYWPGVPFIVGIVIFCNGGYHRVSMESGIRSYWQEASPHAWDGWNDIIHAVLWVVSYVLSPCDQVRLWISTRFIDSSLT